MGTHAAQLQAAREPRGGQAPSQGPVGRDQSGGGSPASGAGNEASHPQACSPRARPPLSLSTSLPLSSWALPLDNDLLEGSMNRLHFHSSFVKDGLVAPEGTRGGHVPSEALSFLKLCGPRPLFSLLCPPVGLLKRRPDCLCPGCDTNSQGPGDLRGGQ